MTLVEIHSFSRICSFQILDGLEIEPPGILHGIYLFSRRRATGSAMRFIWHSDQNQTKELMIAEDTDLGLHSGLHREGT